MTDQKECWLTYAEVGQLLGISAEAARAMVRRQKWPRRTPNDHGALARVLIPDDRLPPLSQTIITAGHPGDDQPPVRRRPALNGGHLGDGRGSDIIPDQPNDRPDATSDILRTVSETVELLLEPLREQLTIANQRADRAERRIDDMQAALDAKTRELNTLLVQKVTIQEKRRRWWQWRA